MNKSISIKANTEKKEISLIILKSVLGALCASLVLILVFALLLKFIPLSDMTIKIINQIIKFLSLIYGMKIYAKANKNSLFFKGILVGALYGISAFLIFSLLEWNFIINITTLNDILFTSFIGGIAGIIVWIFSKKKL